MKLWVVMLFALLMPGSTWAASGDAAVKVRQGIQYYREGKYDAAARAFGEAGEARPDDPRIVFDRACAFAAQGDAVKATELFQQAALVSDPDLSARSHYNLGNVAAQQARQKFGEKPEKASPQIREEGLRLLAQAVSHYRGCLRREPQHADARHNLELIRLWIKHMEEIWKEQDRQQQREDESLLEMLERLQKRQREVRAQAKLAAAEPASPQRRRLLDEAEEAQRSLAGELKPLKEKISESFNKVPPSGKAGAAAPSPVQAEQALKVLSGLVDRAAQEMSDAADALRDTAAGDADEPQREAVETLDRIYMAVVPWAKLVQRAVQSQQELVDRVEPLTNVGDNKQDFPFDEAAWDQRFVARWAEILPAKAKNALKQLEAMAAGPAAAAPGSSPDGPDPAEAKKQAEAMAEAMEEAIEAGPKIHDLTLEAAGHLQEKQPAEALPKQQEALALLKEILESLPKQTPQQSQDQDQQKQQNQDGEREPKPDRAGQEEKQQQKQREQQQEKQNPSRENQKKQPPQARQQKDMPKEKAEAMIRRVRDRQRQRQERQRELRQMYIRRVPVEKDW